MMDAAMSRDALRDRVKRLMPQAKQDLARMVSYQSVYDPRSRPPEDCDRMADLAIDLFAGAGLHEVRAYETSDGSTSICGHAAGPPGAPTVLLYFHHDVQPPLDEEAWLGPVGDDRAGWSLVRARNRRLQRKHRHASDRPARFGG
jgi:acetylornithine deacetylase/succinyl-diaminopimelate desuccinylase-like protein